jgi:hypothetical protein
MRRICLTFNQWDVKAKHFHIHMYRSLSTKSVCIVCYSTRNRIGFEMRTCIEGPCAVCAPLEPIYGNGWLVSSTSRLLPKRRYFTYSFSYKCGDEQNYTKLFTEIQIYFVWCSSIDTFSLLVWKWPIWHSEDRSSWYTLIIKTNEMH